MIFWVGLSVLHSIFFLFMSFRWRGLGSVEKTEQTFHSLTIIVPLRNEASNLPDFLKDLSNLEYDGVFEVIFIDDHSQDASVDIINAFVSEKRSPFRCFSQKEIGKKAAITNGIQLANHHYILTLDADCRLQPDHLVAYNSAFNKGAVFVCGPVSMVGKGWFQALQTVEFSFLSATGAVFLQLENPIFCNGANLGYKKSIFLEVNGYQGNEHIPSGDDQFLMQKVHARYPGKLAYIKNSSSLVETSAKTSLGALLNQRIRWSGKWKNLIGIKPKLMSFFLLLDYLSIPVLLGWMFIEPEIRFMAAVVLILRFLCEWIFARSFRQFFRLKQVFFPLLSLQIIYPPFITFLGIASIFGNYVWKGRRYDG